MKDRVCIIGSGLGGLLCGYFLSKEGFDITLLEKHHSPGGCLQTFTRGGYSFDTGMHYLGSLSPDQILHRYWRYFGLTAKLELVKMNEDGFDVIFCHGTDFPIAQGLDNFREQLLPYFPGQGTALRTYTDLLQKVVDSHPLYNLEWPSDHSLSPFMRRHANQFLAELSEGLPHDSSGIKLGTVLAGNNFLYAGDPSTTSLDQFALINHSFIRSAWRVAGGSQEIANILVRGIVQHGGKVLLRKQVTTIGRRENIFYLQTADGEQFKSEKVIAGIHPAATMSLMDNISFPKATRERIIGIPNTGSVFSVYLGLKPGMFPFINHNIYHHLSPDSWGDPTPNPSPSGMHPTPNPSPEGEGSMWPRQYMFMTPPEKGQGAFARTAVIMAPMQFDEVRKWANSVSDNRGTSYTLFKTERSERLLNIVYQRFPSLKEAIATVEVSTPLTWRDYTGTPEGSMYGIKKEASHPEKTMILPRTKIRGLFFTGQNVNLHGALGVTVGAVMTCGEVLGLPYVLGKISGKI